MTTTQRATDLDIEIPDVPPIGDRPRTLEEAKAFLTRHLLVGRMPFPRQAHREVYATIQALPGLDGASWAATWAAPADRHERAAEQTEARGDAATALAERMLAYQFNFYGRYPSARPSSRAALTSRMRRASSAASASGM